MPFIMEILPQEVWMGLFFSWGYLILIHACLQFVASFDFDIDHHHQQRIMALHLHKTI